MGDFFEGLRRRNMFPVGSNYNALIEILIVFASFFLVRLLGEIAGIPLTGPLGTVAAIGAIYFLYSRDRKNFQSLGLRKPDNIFRVFLIIVLAVVLTVVIGTVVLEYVRELTNYNPSEDSGRFDYMKGDPVALALSVIGIAWLAAAFGEEVLFRGFLLPRLTTLFGGSNTSWILAVVVQAVFFGLLHGSLLANQILAGLIAIVYGTIYVTLAKRTLWPLIIAHSIPDTISFVQIYSS